MQEKRPPVIVFEIELPSTVVSFKIARDALNRLDRLLRIYGLGSRSKVMRTLVEAFMKTLEVALATAKAEAKVKKVSVKTVVEEEGEERAIETVIDAEMLKPPSP